RLVNPLLSERVAVHPCEDNRRSHTAATERDSMEELKDRYEIIEEAATDAIVTIDEHAKILSISRAAERIFGHRVPEMVGQPVEQIIPDYARYIDEARRHGKHSSVVEVMGIHKSGKT